MSERSYPATKYPTGKLVHTGWPPGTVPPLDTTLDLCHSILEFLSKDLRHVAVVHCLDGKSSTAYLVCALLIYVRFVSSVEAAIAVFSGKRCDPILTACQRASLANLASLAASSPPVLKSPFVTISSLVLEPIPLFNKAGDGCRPFVEVFQGKDRVLSSLQDYARMKGYSITQGDEAAVLPVNITVCGDITVVISHARQALGVLKPVKICQIQLHTSRYFPACTVTLLMVVFFQPNTRSAKLLLGAKSARLPCRGRPLQSRLSPRDQLQHGRGVQRQGCGVG